MSKIKSETTTSSEPFLPRVVHPEYPFRDGGEVIVFSETSPLLKVSIHCLFQEDISLIKSVVPEACSPDGKRLVLKRLEAFLIKQYFIRPQDTKELSWSQILELLKENTSRDQKNEPPKKVNSQNPLMTLPVGQKNWAKILHVSVNTMRYLQRDESENRKYHFVRLSPKGRKWILPLNEVPGDYRKELTPK